MEPMESLEPMEPMELLELVEPVVVEPHLVREAAPGPRQVSDTPRPPCWRR